MPLLLKCMCVIKISDFGLAVQMELNYDHVGTHHYMAPEIFLEDIGYTAKVDVWVSHFFYLE